MIVRLGMIFSLCVSSLAFASDYTTEYEGTWETECTAIENQQLSAKDSVVFSGNTYLQTSVIYADGECKTAYQTVKLSGTFVVGNNFEVKEEAETKVAKKIDGTLESLLIAFHIQEFIDRINQMNFCGLSNWALDEFQDITGLTCQLTMVPEKGTMIYDIAYISENNLQFGISPGVGNEMFRPQELDYTRVFHKK